MARKPIPALPSAAEDVKHEAIDADNGAAREITTADMAVINSAELFKCIGRMQAAHFYETVSSKLIAETYARAKADLGRLGSVVVQLPDGKTKHVSFIEDFCEAVMPVSARRCQQIVSSMSALGDDLYDQAERLGFRARDYQALKALPSDDQELVKQALSTDNRETVLDLLAELAGRNKALRDRQEKLLHSVEAKDDLIANKDEHIEKLLSKKRFKPDPEAIARNDAELAQLQELHDAAHRIEPLILRLGNVMATVDSYASPAMKKRCNQVAELLATHLADLIESNGLTVSMSAALDLRPDWLKNTDLSVAVEAAAEQVEAKKAATKNTAANN